MLFQGHLGLGFVQVRTGQVGRLGAEKVSTDTESPCCEPVRCHRKEPTFSNAKANAKVLAFRKVFQPEMLRLAA